MEALHRLQPDPTDRLLEAINPQNVERGLEELAKIGGKPWKSPSGQEYLGTNRLALSAEDEEARRNVIVPAMRAAGMHPVQHPLADIGIYHGEDPSLAPVVLMSHVDTVPDGDHYDGVLGVMSAIEVVRALGTTGLRPMRNIMVVSLTGEESARFGFAMFGSRALAHGLTTEELSAGVKGEPTLREVLGIEDAVRSQEPIFGRPGGYMLPSAVVELHVEQHDSLERSGTNIGVVETIAAPERYEIGFGSDPIPYLHHTKPFEAYYELQVHGEANHSGATPMGDKHRADGLVATANLLRELDAQFDDLHIGEIDIEGEAMNKVPGVVTTKLLLGADTKRERRELAERLNAALANYQSRLPERFSEDAIQLEAISREQAGTFFETERMQQRQQAAFATILAANRAAHTEAHQNTVATVGTFKTDDTGVITLKLDARGINTQSRTNVVRAIKQQADLYAAGSLPINFGAPLSGSGEPINMSPALVEAAERVIERYGIGSYVRMFSAAGHDAQNMARAGAPSVMLFVPSHNGIAHRPDAYTSPEDIARGTYALGALALELANRL